MRSISEVTLYLTCLLTHSLTHSRRLSSSTFPLSLLFLFSPQRPHTLPLLSFPNSALVIELRIISTIPFPATSSISLSAKIKIYRVFIKYCVFFQDFSKVCHLSLVSTRLLLVVQKITSKYE